MLQLVTFNLRMDTPEDGRNCFDGRKTMVRRALETRRPDIVGFQEVLPHMADFLRQSLEGYTLVGCGRERDLGGEACSVAFRAGRFRLIAMQTFWLSPTPDLPGTRYAVQSPCPRTAVEVLLEDREEKKVLRVINTHLDHEGAPARRLGLEQILRHAASAGLFPDAPCAICGDMNAEPGDEAFACLEGFPGYTCATSGIGVTYHGYGRVRGSSIDAVFLRGAIRCVRAEKWTEEENGIFLSDHYPVCATLAFSSGN